MSTTDKYIKYKNMVKHLKPKYLELKKRNSMLEQELKSFTNKCSCSNPEFYGGSGKVTDKDSDDIRMEQIIKEELSKSDNLDDIKIDELKVETKEIKKQSKDQTGGSHTIFNKEEKRSISVPKTNTILNKEEKQKKLTNKDIISYVMDKKYGEVEQYINEISDVHSKVAIMNYIITEVPDTNIIELFNHSSNSKFMKEYMYKPFCYARDDSIVISNLAFMVYKLKKAMLLKYLVDKDVSLDKEHIEINVRDKVVQMESINSKPVTKNVAHIVDLIADIPCACELYVIKFLDSEIDTLLSKKLSVDSVIKIVYKDCIKLMSQNMLQNLIDSVCMYVRNFTKSRVYVTVLLKIIKKEGQDEILSVLSKYLIELMKMYPLNDYSSIEEMSKVEEKLVDPNSINSFLSGNDDNLRKLVGYNALKLYKVMTDWLQSNYESYDTSILISNIKSELPSQKDLYVKYIIK